MNNHRYISFIIICLSIYMFLPGKIFAEGTSLTISPSVIRIQAKPPADVWTPFTIRNNTNKPISLKIGYKEFDPQASSNGNVIFLNDGQNFLGVDKKIFTKIQIVDDQNISHDSIDISPRQQLQFRLRITLPQNEPVSDYYFSLIFLESIPSIDQNDANSSVEDQKSLSTIQAGVGLNILLSVGDKQAPSGSIDNFSAPGFIDKGPIPFTLSIQNSGDHFISPHGVILIKNIFGQTVGKVAVPAATILAGTTRNISGNSFTQNANTSISNLATTNSSLVWPESLLIGMYTATLTLTLSDNGPVYVRTIHFIAFPYIFFIEIGAIIVVIFYIYLRVKRKMK